MSTSDELVIVSAHWNEDLDWLKNAPCPVVVCDKEGAKPHTILENDKYKCPVTPNRGNEASAYLNFIVNNYDNLPEYVAFIHGHQTADHQQQGEDLVNYIINNKQDFHNVHGDRAFVNTNVETNLNFKTIVDDWNNVFMPIFNIECPRTITYECCAQFIVSRERIRQRPKESYQSILEWLLSSDTVEIAKQKATGLEYFWHYIFGQPLVEDGAANVFR